MYWEFLGRRKNWLIRALALTLGLVLLSNVAMAQQSAVFRLVVNMEEKGETFAVVAADGDVMVPRSTLDEIRVRDLPPGERVNGEPHVSLRALTPAVTYAIDQDTSTLNLTIAPERFSRTVREYFFNQPPPNLRTTFSNSAFLNYSLIATDEKSLAGTAEVAARVGHWLGQSTFVYTKTESTENARRLLSTMSHDSPDDQRRITIGDVSAFSGLLGSGGVLGGIGISRNFGLTPYFYPTPGLNLSGLLETPSEVETYVNGRLVKREHLSPGAFTLQNVPVNNGLNNTTIVIRDAFQRVTQINAPFYMSPQLLKQGLSDYSYNVGFRRTNLGLESNDYREWQAIAFQRYGWTPWLTAGFRGELSAQRTNIGPLSSLRLGSYGQLDTNFAVSRDHSTVGYGALASYTYSSGVVSVRGSVQYLSRDYANLATSAVSDKPKLACQHWRCQSAVWLAHRNVFGDDLLCAVQNCAGVWVLQPGADRSSVSASERFTDVQTSADHRGLCGCHVYPGFEPYRLADSTDARSRNGTDGRAAKKSPARTGTRLSPSRQSSGSGGGANTIQHG